MFKKSLKKNLLILLTFFLFNLTVVSQNNYEFFGAIKLNGNDKTLITYRLVFEENNGIIKGYSVTDLDGNHETKNLIEGTYDKKEKLFSFKEKDILYTKSKFDESSFCFVNFSGKVKLVENTSKVEGNFKGLYKNNTKCIDGTVTLVGSNRIYNLANKVNKKIQKSKKVDAKTKEQVNPIAILDSLKINKLVSNQNLNVFWNSKKFKMDIFDSEKEDGDIINVYHNNVLILSKYKVLKTKKSIEIILESPTNEFVIEALNDGLIAPNTAKIILYDDKRTIELLSKLNKNEKASITVIKKEP